MTVRSIGDIDHVWLRRVAIVVYFPFCLVFVCLIGAILAVADEAHGVWRTAKNAWRAS